MTPRSVLDAGRAERERWSIGYNSRIPTHFAEVSDDEWADQFLAPTEAECQDFIDDRVFRAMLRALAENKVALDIMARGLADVRILRTSPQEQITAALLALAEAQDV